MSIVPEKIEVNTHNPYISSTPLSPINVLSNPLDQFLQWFSEAQSNPAVQDPEIVSLATSTPTGRPSIRVVLLKRVDSRGFVFFTNYNSRKANEIDGNPQAALSVYWSAVHRQVRVVGRVEKVSKVESEEYFKTRPMESRIGAWASPQSDVIGEGELAKRYERVEKDFGARDEEGRLNVDVPLPEFWGGYRIIPE